MDRAIRELEIAELVAWTADGYVTTAPGKQAAAQYRGAIESVADILSAREVVAVLPRDSPIQPSLLTDAVVECSADSPPYHLPAGVRDRIVAAERVRVYLPALTTPQLLDCYQQQVIHEGLTLDLLTNSALFETLSTEFPGLLGTMATADRCTVFATDTAPDAQVSFGLLLAETETTTTVSIITYDEQRTIQSVIHNRSAAAVQWAETLDERIRDGASDVTGEARTLAATRSVAREGMSTGERIALEAEGFVQLTPEYFTQRAPAPPVTGWRTGFDLIDVHAGYAIDREIERDGVRHNLTTDLIERLTDGTNIAVLGPPGSGKSTVGKTVACRWYEQGRGPVFYRASAGPTFTSPAVLSAHLRDGAAGHALVVIEDAVRAETNAIFRVMRAFRGTETVTFLLDAREKEWADPESFPIDAGLDAYRIETTETVTVPALDDTERERFVRQFEQTTDHDFGDSPTVLQANPDTTDPPVHDASEPAEVLLLLHRLSLQADPLAVHTTNIPTVLAEDVQRVYETLRQAGERVLDVGVFVNLLNAAGLDVAPALVCALANDGDETEIEAVLDALSVLEGRVIFEREEGASYRVVHEVWSALFLDHSLDVTTERSASRRVGRCVTSLLSLADKPERRDQLMAAFMHPTPMIERIADAPGEWADTTVEQLFGLGRRRRGLAPLFGTTGDSCIDLPDACSPTVTVECTLWRALMAQEAGDLDRAEHEYECLADLADDVEATDPEWAATLRGRRRNGLGVVTWQRSALDTAETHFMRAIDHYREANSTLQTARTRTNLGLVAYYRGDLETAEASTTQSLDTYREHGYRRLEAVALQNLAVIISMTGALETTIDYSKQALDIYREIGDRRNIADCLHNLGEDNTYLGNFDTATSYGTQALELYRETGARDREARTFDFLGQINRMKGDFDTAEDYHSRSLDLLREIGDRRNEAWCLTAFGILARKRGDLATAEARCETSREICQEIGDQPGEADSLAALGTIAYERGDLDTATEYAKESRTLNQETGDARGEAVSRRLLGRIARDRERIEAALAVYREIGAVRDTIETTERLAALCEAMNDPETAIEHCESARDLARETEFVDLPPSLLERHTNLAEQLAGDDST